MKANELMTGVFVYFCCFDGSRIVVRVTGFKDGIVYGDSETGSHWCNIEKVEPIPLTTEIFEKNGFYYDEDRKAYLMGVIFRVKPEGYGIFSFEICGCPYTLSTVHQLQHILRFCGIDKEIEL